MSNEMALGVLQEMASNSALDDPLISLLADNFDKVNYSRKVVQEASNEDYQELIHLMS